MNDSENFPDTNPENQADGSDIDLAERVAQLEDELRLQKESVLRQAAEFENARKRLTKEKDEFIKFASERLLQEIFPVLDSFEMTYQHLDKLPESQAIRSGVELIDKQLVSVLQKNGLEEVAALGEVFDPHQHEAIGTEESDEFESGLVCKVHRKGYRLQGRLLRPALVSIVK